MSDRSISEASPQSFHHSYEHVEDIHEALQKMDIHASLQELRYLIPDGDSQQILFWTEERSNRLRTALGIPVSYGYDRAESEEELCEPYNDYSGSDARQEGDESPEEFEEDRFYQVQDEFYYEGDTFGYKEDAPSYEGDGFDYEDTYGYDGDSFDY